ncbi:MAG: PEGA domain-containing protein, partial [Planctomycetota bacterium]
MDDPCGQSGSWLGGRVSRRPGSALLLTAVFFLLSLGVLVPGCVERTIEVRSDPPGAEVYLDRAFRGRTPVRLPFHHYGVREITVRKAGFKTRR